MSHDRPRQPSRPDLLDQQPDRAATRHHPGREDADQPAPKRITLTELPAVRPPERKPTLTDFPSPPPLPLDLGATKRPPLPWGKTVRAESAPAVVAAARRTYPPSSAEPPPTSIRVPADETRSGGPSASPLPPASLSPDGACIEATRRRAEAAELKAKLAEAKIAELERQARVRVESLAPGPYQSPIERAPAPVAPEPASTTASAHPDVKDRNSRVALRIALAGFLTAIAIPLAGWITVMRDAEISRIKSERADVKSDVAKSTADEATAKANTNAKAQVNIDQQFRQKRANDRELWRIVGVDVPKTEGDPEPQDLGPKPRFCPPGQVCPGPQIVLTRAP